MTFILNEIKRNDFKKGLENIGTDKKWFLFFNRIKNLKFFSITLPIGDVHQTIGMAYLYKKDSNNDFSFFIHPKYRQKDYAKKFVEELIKLDNTIQFSVSVYNVVALIFFRSIEGLYLINSMNIKTVIFRKKYVE